MSGHFCSSRRRRSSNRVSRLSFHSGEFSDLSSRSSRLVNSELPSVARVGGRRCRSGLLDAPEGIFHLAKIDVTMLLRQEWDGRGARALLEDRAARRAAWLAQRTPPDVVVEGGHGVDASADARPALESADGWSGLGVSSGRATGPVRVIRHPHDGGALALGDVLVAPSTDPGWTPLFLRAGAIVMESGGYLSHGAIVAREFGLPAVVNIPGILDQLNEGELVLVDGDAACVRRASHARTPASERP